MKMNKSYLSKKDKNQIIKFREDGFSIKKICEMTNKRYNVVSDFLKDSQIEKPLLSKIQLTQEDITNIIDLYKNNYSIREIIDLYNHKIKSYKTIHKILKNNGIELRGRKRFSKMNHSFFNKIDTEEKAYILGLMLADGYVIEGKKNRSHRVGIELHVKDKYMVEKIKEIWESSINVRSKNGKGAILNVQSSEMAKDLEQYTVTPRKSFTAHLTLDKIPKEYHHHYIRGIFDGDGTIYCRRKDINSYNIGFTGNLIAMEQIQNFLVNKINISKTKIVKRDNIHYFQNAKKDDVKNFYNYIYQDATIYLKRKKIMFEEFIENEKNRVRKKRVNKI